MEVNGTLIWYYNICKREVWLMGHYIVPDQSNTDIDLGRFIHEQSYKRNEKEVIFGNVRFDIVMNSKDGLVIGETKKSSHFQDASKWQLLYYINIMKEAGVDASGVLLYPKEKKRVEVILTEENRMHLFEMVNEINAILELNIPPEPQNCKYCHKCGYEEYCWA